MERPYSILLFADLRIGDLLVNEKINLLIVAKEQSGIGIIHFVFLTNNNKIIESDRYAMDPLPSRWNVIHDAFTNDESNRQLI